MTFIYLCAKNSNLHIGYCAGQITTFGYIMTSGHMTTSGYMRMPVPAGHVKGGAHVRVHDYQYVMCIYSQHKRVDCNTAGMYASYARVLKQLTLLN